MTTIAYANETNPLVDGAAYHAATEEHVFLGELASRGGKITRVRILREGGRYDISYINGEIDGKQVSLKGVYSNGWFRGIKRDLVQIAIENGVNAKALGLLNEDNWSVLS